jgi:uncharacterized protein
MAAGRSGGYRLAQEGSPFLRAHAKDQIDWYPWGDEAIHAAKAAGQPIFLSIGYSTCHWCRVMARESFNRPEVAQLLNESFISVLVDREQLPQVDAVYMGLAQAMSDGAGGWPLNLFLTPDLAPFFVATYMPPSNQKGLVGLAPVVSRIQQLWGQAEQREQLVGQADELIEAVRAEMEAEEEEEENGLPDSDTVAEAAEMLFQAADPLYGGTMGSPKFPVGSQIAFMLRLAHDSTESRCLFFTELTLDAMARGGIYDQLGGGFSHYTLDARWRLPHFEKMLSDNALLASVYLEAWQVTHRPQFREVCTATLDYILRELRHPEGGFYCAQAPLGESAAAHEEATDRKPLFPKDEEVPDGITPLEQLAQVAQKIAREEQGTPSHRQLEGGYYIWRADEVHQLLGPDEGSLFAAYYDFSPKRPEQPHILHVPVGLEEFARKRHLAPQDVAHRLERSRAILLAARSKRPHLQCDEKVTVSWNGLCIHALAAAALPLNNPSYLQAAQQAAQFIRDQCWLEGELLRCWYDGLAQSPACLNDYACLIHGLITLFEAGGGVQWLRWALELTQQVEEQFGSDGAFFMTRPEELALPLRIVEWTDDGEPAGNALHCHNLLRLWQLTGRELYKNRAEALLKAAGPVLEEVGIASCAGLIALQRYLSTKKALMVIALGGDAKERSLIEAIVTREFLPYVTIVWQVDELKALLPEFADKQPIEGRTAVYIRQGDQWEPPITDLDQLRERVHKL